MRHFLLPIFAMILLVEGCGIISFYYQGDNVKWAREHNVDIQAMTQIIPADQWMAVVEHYHADISSSCFFDPRTLKIFVKSGYYLRAYIGSTPIWDTYEEYCLDHEVGHFREWLDRVPFHSTYAR